MNIATVNKYSFFGFIVLLGVWGYVVYHIMNIQGEQSIKSEGYHLQSYNIANELRQSSDDLTRMARTYVSTGNEIYKQYYFQILAIRNGDSPRPNKYPSTYWYTSLAAGDTALNKLGLAIPLQTIMRNKGFTEQEFSLLRKSQNRSDKLVNMEKQAFSAMKGLYDDGNGNFIIKREADNNFARKLLFSPQYHEAKIAIMQPIQEFLEAVEYRITSESKALQGRQIKFLWYAILLVIISTLMALIIANYVRTKIVSPIFSLKNDAHIIATGNYQARSIVSVKNEIGSLSRSLNEMAECIELDIKKLQKLATTDDLVGISNRRAFIKSLELEIDRAHRYDSPLSLLMLDIDNFKLFNDMYGHLIGDEVLKLVCKVSQAELRDNDLMGRLGGEEFAIILPVTIIDSAIIVAERIRIAIENASLKYNSDKLKVTISIGATQLVKDDAINTFQKRVDMAMYKAKENGRNQTSWL